MEERNNEIATERDESGAATCEVKNKLCVIIGSKEHYLPVIPRCEKCHYTMTQTSGLLVGSSASTGQSGW
jgi:hypothetical protein